MKLIITEKPSVAQDVAAAIGNAQKSDGYIIVGDYNITWAFGHLLEIDNSILPKERNLDVLPILPDKFNYLVVAEKKKQFSVIKNLVQKATDVIIATDAGREGELIARLILNNSGWHNWQNTYRLWTSEALSKEVVNKALKNLAPAARYDGLYYAGLGRQHADWITGMNLSMAISIKANGGWSCGRVQTPTLSLIVKRDAEIAAFKKESYFVIKAKHEVQRINFESFYQLKEQNVISVEEEDENSSPEAQNLRLSKEKAFELVKMLSGQRSGFIEAVIKFDKNEPAPLLHSLTSLQREANQVFGYSAQKTLDIAQALYEKHKCLSYPRSDSNHLAESSRHLVKEVMIKLSLHELIENIEKPGKRVFDNSKLTDHHAVIPLNAIPDGCSETEINIFNLVLRKFKGVFMDNYEYQITQVKIKIGDCDFFATGKTEIKKGWKSLYHDKEQNKILPQLMEKTTVSVLDVLTEERFTSPPPFFTDSSILRKMEILGLGTPATRASILERLLTVGYLIREKKNLVSTDKGRELIRILVSSKLVSAQFTAEWEKKLDVIQKENTGLNGYNSFLSGIKTFVNEELRAIKNSDIKTINRATPAMIHLANKLAKEKKLKNTDTSFEGTKAFIDTAMKTIPKLGKCSCGKTITDSKMAYNCVCGKVVWKDLAGKKITSKQAESLMQGKKVAMKGLKKREGVGTYEAAIFIKPDGKIGFDFGK